MKKITTVLSLLFVILLTNAQTIYYVEESGDNANDGLSEANAFASIATAFDSIQTNYNGDTYTNEYIINVGEGTFTESELVTYNSNTATTITIQGESAKSTILQGVDTPDGVFRRLFAAANGNNKYLSITLNDLTVKNYGGNNEWASTNGIIGLVKNGMEFYANRCVFSDIIVRATAVLASTLDCKSEFIDCSFININSGNGAVIAVTRTDKTVVKNCTFLNCIKDYSASGNGVTVTDDNYVGHIFMCRVPHSWKVCNVIFVNNTIIGSKVINTDSITTKDNVQCAVYIANPLEGTKTTGGKINLTFANNIISGGECTSYTDTDPVYLDLNVDATKIDAGANSINFIKCSNNVMDTAAVDFPKINTTYFPSSSELFFNMDGADVKQDTTTTGLVYVATGGTAIEGQGIYILDTIPTADVVGTTRSTTAPWIGSYEEEDVATALQEAIESSVSIYPNPAEGMIFIKGDVAKVELYNISGRMVQSSTLETTNVDISGLSAGMYFVRCQNATGNLIATERIIKK